MSSTERTLIYSTALVFTTYLYLTAKTFQRLPPIPSMQEILDGRDLGKVLSDKSGLHVQHIDSSLGDFGLKKRSDLNVKSNNNAAFSNTNGVDEASRTIEQIIAEQSPFLQSIDFAKLNRDVRESNENLPREANKRQNQLKQRSSEVKYDHDQLEEIVHPAVELLPSLANEIDKLIVPKFYNPPIFKKHGGVRSYLGNYGERLMTLKEAKSIGSFVSNQSGDGPNQLETIFVAIASYRDFQCQQTIESILSRAKFPQRVRVAVVDQLDYANDKPCSQPAVPCDKNPDQILCKYKKQIDFYEMDAAFAVGECVCLFGPCIIESNSYRVFINRSCICKAFRA